MSILKKINGLIKKLEIFILKISMLLLATLQIVNVISRNIFNNSLVYAEEISQLLIILTTFIGISYAARVGRHIRMSALYDLMNDKVKKIAMIIMSGITSIIMFMLTKYSIDYFLKVKNMGRVTTALQIPMYLFIIAVPIGFFLTGIQYALTVIKNFKADDVYISFEQVDEYEEVDLDDYEDIEFKENNL